MDPSSKDLGTIPANQVPSLSGRRFKVPCYGQAGRDHIGKCRQIFWLINKTTREEEAMDTTTLEYCGIITFQMIWYAQ